MLSRNAAKDLKVLFKFAYKFTSAGRTDNKLQGDREDASAKEYANKEDTSVNEHGDKSETGCQAWKTLFGRE